MDFEVVRRMRLRFVGSNASERASEAAGWKGNRWIPVVSGVVIMLISGVVWAIGVFVPPWQAAFNVERGPAVLTFTIVTATTSIAMIPVGRWLDRKGPKIVASVGGLLIGVSYVLTGFALNMYMVYLTFGVLNGIGTAMCYVTPITTGMKWFPDKKGLVAGIAAFAFGFGTAFLAPFISFLIGTLGLKATFSILGLAFLIIILVSAQFMQFPPAGWVPQSWKPAESKAKLREGVRYDFSPSEMLRTKQFFLLWILFAFTGTPGLTVGGNIVAFAKDAGIAEWIGALILGVFAIANGLGRIVGGGVSDKLGRTRTMVMIFAVQAVVMSLLVKATSPAWLMLVVILVGLCFGPIFALFPATISDYFGEKYVGVNYGLVFTGYGTASVMGPALAGFLFDLTKSYYYPFQLISIFCAIAAILSLVTKPPALPAENA